MYDHQPNIQSRLHPDSLKHAVRELADEIRAKVNRLQGGIYTFGDLELLGLIGQLEQLDPALPWEQSVLQLSEPVAKQLIQGLELLKRLLGQRAQGRFVDFQQREARLTPAGLISDCDIGTFELAMSQGMVDCMRWKGMPLFKTVYDFSLYTMILWSLRPASIIELGSGTGASAIWLADVARMFGIRIHVYSVDLKRPQLQNDNVTFIEGDCRVIEQVFPEHVLRDAAHPWIVIEDAHVNVSGVLGYFHQHLAQGDYCVVEDSQPKQVEIGRFLAQYPGCYKVDTYYTDFFGRNATCAQDSIFVRV